MNKKRVADIIVECLQNAGVKRCYGIVGDTMNLTAHSIARSEIEWVHMRHEEAGAFAAAAEASLTGRLTACAGSCGPGGLHFINGLYEANRNRAPVVLLASQIVRRDIGFDSIQEVDFTEVFRGCSVFCEMVLTADQAKRKAVAACQAALARRGVAVLIVPADIAEEMVHDDTPYAVHVSRPLTRPNDVELDRIAELLNASRSIAIYAGAGCEGAHDEVVATAARLRAPTVHTSRGKDFIEHDNPYDVGMTGILGGPAGYHALLDCDVLLLLGADFVWSQFYPKDATIIQIDADPTHLGRRHPVTFGAVGDIRPTLEALLPRLQQHDDDRFLSEYQARHRKEIARFESTYAQPGSGPISGHYLTRVINRQAAKDALFVADDGTPTVWMLRHVDTYGTRRTFASLLHGTMAAGMPSALGLQKCQPGRQVISLSGDGGFAMLMGDLLTAVQEKLPIKICVFDNGALGFINIEQKAEGLVPVYTDLLNPDFGRIAEAAGLWGRLVTDGADVEEAVAAWLAEPGPALLQVKVAPMELVTPPFIEPKAAMGMALYSAKAILQGKGRDVWQMLEQNLPV